MLQAAAASESSADAAQPAVSVAGDVTSSGTTQWRANLHKTTSSSSSSSSIDELSSTDKLHPTTSAPTKPTNTSVLRPISDSHSQSLRYTLAYLTLPSGWAGYYTCPALRPYQFGPMRNPDVTRRSQ